MSRSTQRSGRARATPATQRRPPPQAAHLSGLDCQQRNRDGSSSIQRAAAPRINCACSSSPLSGSSEGQAGAGSSRKQGRGQVSHATRRSGTQRPMWNRFRSAVQGHRQSTEGGERWRWSAPLVCVRTVPCFHRESSSIVLLCVSRMRTASFVRACLCLVCPVVDCRRLRFRSLSPPGPCSPSCLCELVYVCRRLTVTVTALRSCASPEATASSGTSVRSAGRRTEEQADSSATDTRMTRADASGAMTNQTARTATR